jgi:hypothetical protein
MGSGFKTFTAGAVLTASDVNNYLMEQSIMYFATTTARDSALSAVLEDGMVVYVGSNDANEGLWTYNGTSWKQGPGWNAPWGVVACTAGGTSNRGVAVTTSNSSTTSGTAAANWSPLTVTFTANANRIYRTTAFGILGSDNASGSDYASLLITNSSGTSLASSPAVVQSVVIEGRSVSYVDIGLTGSNMRKVMVVRLAGVGAITGQASATRQASIVVEDIGPSGAPA